MKEQRIYIIDILRALAIIGMVLSGQMLWSKGLPAWMFHAQIPPPNFTFDPSVVGITWVDLVFPFFLFSMGAALPLSMGKRAKQGASNYSIIGSIVSRWAMLSIFSIALANFRVGALGDMPMWLKSTIQLFVWGLFTMIFIRPKALTNHQTRSLHIAGIVIIGALMTLLHFACGLQMSIHRSDIIILILANMALLGGLIWWFTRERRLVRLAILAIIVALKISSSVEGSWVSELWGWTPASWLFEFDFLKYLAIIITGSIAGDIICKYASERANVTDVAMDKGRYIISGAIALAIVLVNLWGLFTRTLVVNVALTIVMSVILLKLLKKEKTLHDIAVWGVFWLIFGLFIEPFEGGIRKDYATISYLFVTSGLASMVLIAAQGAIKGVGVKFSWLVKCGQNPMIAYTLSGFVIIPIITLLHLAGALAQFSELTPWCGFYRGVIITILMVILTIFFTNKKIFWRT